MIKLICVGKIKENYLKEALKEYEKRLSKYIKLEIIEVMDSSIDDVEKCLKQEEERIEKHINQKDYLILLDLSGKEYSSVEFSKHFQTLEQNYANLTFLVGGSYGVSSRLKQRAKEK